MICISLNEEQRVAGIRSSSIKYVQLAKRYQELKSIIATYRTRCLLRDYTYLNAVDEMHEIKDKMDSIDLGLGYAVKEGDHDNIPEYREALKY